MSGIALVFQLGHTVISSERASDYIRPIEQQADDELPFKNEEEKQ